MTKKKPNTQKPPDDEKAALNGDASEEGARAGEGSRCRRPPFWAVVVGVALMPALQQRLARVFQNAEPIKTILPDPALFLLERLNLTEKVDGLIQSLQGREQAPSPGLVLKGKLRPKHPVVIVPGITTCGLEIWEPGECLGKNNFFRERIWGGMSMARALLNNLSCWLDHLALDPETGLDPAGKEVRAISGLAAGDYFVPGYWIWSKFIETAGRIGYRPDNLLLACYDWRLPLKQLELRDGFLSRLRMEIEMLVSTTGEKAVIIAHSMGANVWLFFLQWITMVAGEHWAADHIHAFVSLSGAVLGALGPLGAVLSGEMQTTAALGPLNKLLGSELWSLNPTRMRDVARTLGGLGTLLPKGGSSVWGSSAKPTDIAADVVTLDGDPMTLEETLKYLEDGPEGNYPLLKWSKRRAALPQSKGRKRLSKLQALEAAIENPLASALPQAPSMRIYCMYGVGLPTERAYWYSTTLLPNSTDRRFGAINYTFFSDPEEKDAKTSSGINRAWYANGVASTDGDGTVPLVGLGYMCAHGWRRFPAFNPGRSVTVVREYEDQPSAIWEDPRGGPTTAKHVEIIGNSEVLTDLMYILAGEEQELVVDRIHSEILNISERITHNLEAELGIRAEAA